MTDDVRDRPEESPGSGEAGSGAKDPKETFQQISHIAISMAFDLVDKLRFFEKETLKLSDEEVEERIPHLATCLERLRTAYVEFAEVDF